MKVQKDTKIVHSLQMGLRSNVTVKVLPKELLRAWFITKVKNSKSRCIVTVRL